MPRLNHPQPRPVQPASRSQRPYDPIHDGYLNRWFLDPVFWGVIPATWSLAISKGALPRNDGRISRDLKKRPARPESTHYRQRQREMS